MPRPTPDSPYDTNANLTSHRIHTARPIMVSQLTNMYPNTRTCSRRHRPSPQHRDWPNKTFLGLHNTRACLAAHIHSEPHEQHLHCPDMLHYLRAYYEISRLTPRYTDLSPRHPYSLCITETSPEIPRHVPQHNSLPSQHQGLPHSTQKEWKTEINHTTQTCPVTPRLVTQHQDLPHDTWSL